MEKLKKSVGLMLRWVLGGFSVLFAMGALASSEIIAALALLVMASLLLPPVKIPLSKGKKIIIFVVCFIVFAAAANSSNPSQNELKNTEPKKAVVLPYEKLGYENLALVENFYYFVSAVDKSEENLERVAKEIKTRECQKDCNILLYDNKKAYDLDREREALVGGEALSEWDSENFVFLADHNIGMLEFFGEIFMPYPLKDGPLYNELKAEEQKVEVEEDIAPVVYSFHELSEFEVGTAERALAEYVWAWKNQDWERMANYAQKTWLSYEDDPGDLLEAWYDFKTLKGFEISEVKVVSSVAADITFIVQYEAFASRIEEKQITAKVIKETEANKTDERGQWGVNPTSALAEKDL